MDPIKLEVLAALTLELTKLRQKEVPHLCIENFAPKVLCKLLEACGMVNSSGRG